MINELKLFDIILAPHVTEKTMSVGSSDHFQYVFKVKNTATKKEIKAAISHLFKVSVLSVRVVRMKPKRCSSKGRPGIHKGFKKAYITLAEGQQIDLTQKAS